MQVSQPIVWIQLQGLLELHYCIGISLQSGKRTASTVKGQEVAWIFLRRALEVPFGCFHVSHGYLSIAKPPVQIRMVVSQLLRMTGLVNCILIATEKEKRNPAMHEDFRHFRVYFQSLFEGLHRLFMLLQCISHHAQIE